MVIDTSAVLAVLLDEPEREEFITKIAAAPRRQISVASVLESTLVLETQKGEPAGRELDLFLHRGKIEMVAVDEMQLELARSAWRRFGKGRHPAGLNYGDLFSYALARTTGEELLFKGADFTKTDVSPA